MPSAIGERRDEPTRAQLFSKTQEIKYESKGRVGGLSSNPQSLCCTQAPAEEGKAKAGEQALSKIREERREKRASSLRREILLEQDSTRRGTGRASMSMRGGRFRLEGTKG